MRFAKQNPSEILIIKVRFDGLSDDSIREKWADAAWALLGNRLLAAPDKGQPVPTYSSAVESNRNIILGMGLPEPKGHPIAPYYWPVGGNTACWLGENNPQLWNEPTWQSGELKQVLKSTEEFIEKNQGKLAERNRFWLAQLQLTPVLGQSITTFFKEGGSIRPKDLALGGGIGTHGSFKGSNKELRESRTLKKALWRKHASCIMYDFCDKDTTGDIVAMNLPEGEDDDNDGPSGGGGGRGGHGEGRGGGGGGRGRGDHHRGGGGRGRGHD
jgi:hypothetical protein